MLDYSHPAHKRDRITVVAASIAEVRMTDTTAPMCFINQPCLSRLSPPPTSLMPTIPPADAAPISFNLNTTFGALEIGILVALFLSGMVTVQVLSYYRRYWSDSWVLKCVVSIAWILDLGHSVAICHTLYTVTVTQFGQPESLLIPPLSLDTAILLSGFIGPLEQGWFTYRLYRLTKRVPLPLLCMSLALARFVGIIGLSTIALHAYPITEYNERAGWLIEAIVIVSAALDTILVSALCYYLSSWRLDKSRVLHKLVNQIMTWTVETGVMTIFGALGLLISFLTMKDNYVYVGFFVVVPKLFANSLLLSVNAREQYSNVIRSNPASLPVRTRNASMRVEMEMARLPSSPTASEGLDILGIRSPAQSDFYPDKDRETFVQAESPGFTYDDIARAY
ncbi:hypothetical protein B0H16DRAFT_1558616 [Mycena metata]|uniref:DUF6534 domain-containing protein n=1 Tax=Mycena metata TaxID=1033252 RepID=A0AAD7N4M1_9AGAR|nr:hypothetical protein B0H16DRAFT_1558616 [Mycena metata]